MWDAVRGWPSCVLRLGGIYGPRRTRLLERVRAGRATIAPGPPRYTNRIHREPETFVVCHRTHLFLKGFRRVTCRVKNDNRISTRLPEGIMREISTSDTQRPKSKMAPQSSNHVSQS